MRKNFINEIYDFFLKNNNVFFLTGDLGYGVLDKFVNHERFVNVGICEQNMASMAAGIASRGNKVIIYSIGNFATLRCLEQIRNDIVYHEKDVVIVATGAGFEYGSMGITHHMLEDIAIMNAIPQLNIFSPSNQNEARHVAKFVMSNKGPHYVRLGKYKGDDLDNNDIDIQYPIKICDSKNSPSLIIYFTGSIRYNVEQALSQLPNEIKNNIEVYSVPFVNGFKLQEPCIKNDKLKSILIIEEHNEKGGLNSIIFKSIYKLNKNLNIEVLAVKNVFISDVGTTEYLLEQAGLGVNEIYGKIVNIMENK